MTAIVQRTPDPRDPATSTSPLGMLGQPRPVLPADYRAFLNPKGLRGARIGVVRDFEGFSPHADAIFDAAVTAIGSAGATLIDPVSFPHLADINSGLAEFTVLLFDFKIDIANYLKTRTGVPIASPSLQALIDFNNANATQEMPFFAQEIFDLANMFSSDPNAIQPLGLSYNDSLAIDQKIGAIEGIDQLLKDNKLDALIAGTDSPAWPTDLINGDHFTFGTSSPCAIAGYPIINVPAGMSFGVPVGISFMGTAFSEPTLIKLASGFEAVTQARQKPQFLQTLPFSGPSPFKVRGRGLLPKRNTPLVSGL